MSPELTKILHTQVQRHFENYTRHHIDKTTIPLYLFLSGAGTGKSRNAAELCQTTYKCFSGHYFKRNEKLADLILHSFVFHVSFENGTSILPSEKDPLLAIGSRVLLQLIQDEAGSISLEDVHAKFHLPTPLALISFFAKQNAKRAFFLVVDGLKNVQDIFGETIMMQTLTALGDLAHRGFIIVCGTSTLSGPVDKILKGSRRRRALLPCTSLEPPRINDKPAFDFSGIVEKVLAQDCGGHGRALELLMDIIPALSRDATIEVKFLVVERLRELYKGALPREADALGIVKAVIANRCLERDEIIPGTSVTPDEVVQNGLIRFKTDLPNSDYPSGYLEVPYIWLLVLTATYQGNRFFEELQLLDYRDFRAREDSTLPGGFSWSDFECLMVKIRKIKSQVFEDQSCVTLGNLHKGAFMTDETKAICIRNHHLRDDVVIHWTMSKTTSSNHHQWFINTDNSGDIDLRWHKHIIRNAAGASAADAILSLQSEPVRTECLQFKNTKEGRLNFHGERTKAAGPDDIFALFCTSSISRLRVNSTYNVPPGTVLVVKENWQNYFGPYAGRSYLFAKEV